MRCVEGPILRHPVGGTGVPESQAVEEGGVPAEGMGWKPGG